MSSRQTSARERTVNPHGCGDYVVMIGTPPIIAGSPPRLWGYPLTLAQYPCCVGSPPRLWGLSDIIL
ncbi:MAG: hypothetical protein ACYC27_10285 [Armatimonadota bacterium]